MLLATGVLLNSGVGVAAGFVIGRQRARQQVVIHGLGDAAVRAAISGVTPALLSQQPGVGKLLVQGLCPLIGGGRVTGGAHNQDRRAALSG